VKETRGWVSDEHHTAPSSGHLFGDDLVCDCGQTWREQQLEPLPCNAATDIRKARMQRHEAGGRR